MKISLHSKGLITSKKIIIPAILVAVASGTLFGTTLTSSKHTGDTSSPLIDQTQAQQDEFNSHENPVSDSDNTNGLQNDTSSDPSNNQVATPAKPSTRTNASPVVAPVVSYEQVQLDDIGNTDCKFTYSDGTTYQWHWQVVNPQGSWMTDGQGLNGHWVTSTQRTGSCDSSVVGRTKA